MATGRRTRRRSQEFLAWLYNDSPNKDNVIVNDRWGNDNPAIGSGHHHGGYFSGGDRQQANPKLLAHKWENAFTLDGSTWGYSRKSNLNSYLDVPTMLYEVVSTVAYGGNVLINVGPTHDGRIATIFQERLLQLGAWLDVNGGAIYGSKKWRAHNDTADHGVGKGVYYTSGADGASVYAFMLSWPSSQVPGGSELTLTQPLTSASTTASMLGCAKCAALKWTAGGSGGMSIVIPPLSPKELPSFEGPWVFKLSNVK